MKTQTNNDIIKTLKTRFDKNIRLHKNIRWDSVEERLRNNSRAIKTLQVMESTGGEPDVIGYDKEKDEYIFCDCSAESPAGRRSLCYDRDALDSRKKNKPNGSALDMAGEIGIEMLTEERYRDLQKLGEFDKKTSNWIKTPESIRKLGGALFCDRRYNQVFTYHNGADSYYASRGFRGLLKV